MRQASSTLRSILKINKYNIRNNYLNAERANITKNNIGTNKLFPSNC